MAHSKIALHGLCDVSPGFLRRTSLRNGVAQGMGKQRIHNVD